MNDDIYQKEVQEISVCDNHLHKPVALIFTCAFPYKEYRCPACGAKYEMLGRHRVEKTLSLSKALRKNKEKWEGYLHSKGIKSCDQLKYKGKWIRYSELPEKSKKYWERVEKSRKPTMSRNS